MTVTASVAETSEIHRLAHRRLVGRQLWNRLVNRIVEDESMDRSTAERIMDQALGFLLLGVKDPDGHYSPSPLVDVGWHTFILYTRPYAKWCKKYLRQHFRQELRGLRHLRNWRPSNLRRLWRLYRRTFIHHSPSDVPGVNYGTGGVARTVAALKRHGMAVDDMLWTNTHRCSNQDGSRYCGDDDQEPPQALVSDCTFEGDDDPL